MRKVFLITEEYLNCYSKRIPIEIISIDMSKLFPVKFRYIQKGYKKLVFHERLSNIDVIN